MANYWDLYVLYIERCVRENYINDIDPNHYQMEWNHFWPKCIFGVWPVGQWLTLKQHAIATALQTLVFKRNCLCPWHKSYLPLALLEFSWPYFCEASVKKAEKTNEKLHEEKDENGRSLHAVEMNRKGEQKRREVLSKPVIALSEDGREKKFFSIAVCADEFGVNESAVRKWVQKERFMRVGKAKGWRFVLEPR